MDYHVIISKLFHVMDLLYNSHPVALSCGLFPNCLFLPAVWFFYLIAEPLLQDWKCYEVWVVFPFLLGKLSCILIWVSYISSLTCHRGRLAHFLALCTASPWFLHFCCCCTSYCFQREIPHVSSLWSLYLKSEVLHLLYIIYSSYTKYSLHS